MTSETGLNASMARAAAAAGISGSFVDGLGGKRVVPGAVIRACMASMGLDAGADGAVLAREILRRRRTVPIAVLTKGKPWRLASVGARNAGACTIETETGETV